MVSGYFEPMTEERDWSKPPSCDRVYRPRLLSLLLYTALTTAILSQMAVYSGLFDLRPEMFYDPPFALGLAGIATVVVVPILYFACSLHLTDTSLKCSSTYLWPVEIIVSDIVSISRPFYLFGAFYLLRTSSPRVSVLLPVFLTELDELVVDLQCMVTEDNELLLALREKRGVRE